MKRRIDLTYTYPHPIESVWRALTDPSALASWFMSTDLVAEVGREFTFRTDPAPGFDGVIHCRVLEVESPHRLRFSWKGGPVDTCVTWTLEAVPGGTRLHVEQTGFSGVRAFIVGLMLESGSKSLFGKKLAEHLDRRTPDETPAECMGRTTRFFRFLATLFARDRSAREAE